MICNFICEKRI